MILLLALLAGLSVLSWFGTELVRRWVKRRRILDVPNERSSHSDPTPRGGGLVFVSVSLAAYLVLHFRYGTGLGLYYPLGALLVALVSWIDDVRELSPVWRLVGHLAAALLVVYGAGAYFSEVSVPGAGTFGTGAAGAFLTLLWIVWMINAYNFMDGIDGLASVQALAASLGWFVTGFLWGAEPLYLQALVLFSTVLGFLLHNWQPARIFMGDVGSAFLGYSFAVFAFIPAQDSLPESGRGILYLLAVLFLWPFVFDSLYTFLKRAYRREKVWKPHRLHLYQRLVIKGMSHARVSMLYGGLAVSVVAGAICFILPGPDRVLLISFLVMITLFLPVFEKCRKPLTEDV